MPKASVDEDGQPALWKNEIRTSEYGTVVAPTGDPVAAKQFDEREFGVLVTAPSNLGHDGGPLGF